MNIPNKIRNLNTLTNFEIVNIVDHLVYCSRTRTQGQDLIAQGDMYYRKIEVKLEGNKDIICRVSYAEYGQDNEIVAFYLEDGTDDIYILPVNHCKHTQEFINTIGITLDFSIINQSLRKTYMLFAEQLQFWNLSDIQLIPNKQLTENWYTVEEITVSDF